MIPKTGVGRVWSIKNRFTVPKSGMGRAWEGAKWSMKKGFGCFMILISCFIFCLSKPFPSHFWEPWEIPEPLLMHPTLGNHEKYPKPFLCFIFGLPNYSHKIFGNHEKYPPVFSCFIFNNYSWEPWEISQSLFMLYFLHSETLPHS